MTINDARSMFRINGTCEHKKPEARAPQRSLLQMLRAIFR
jgi:hypothetical protein